MQERLALHPDLAVKVGPAVSTLRICTIHPESGPELFYAVLRLPAVDAPIDGGAISTNAVALIDPATGKVVRAMRGIFPTGAAFEAAPTGVGNLLARPCRIMRRQWRWQFRRIAVLPITGFWVGTWF